MNFKKALFILVLVGAQMGTQASAQTKPENVNDIEDPFDNAPVEAPSLLNSQNRLFYYQQYNQASEGADNSTHQLAVDLQVQTQQGENWQALTRVMATDNNHEDTQTHVLEAYGSWSSDSKRYGLKMGRIKPQWSNGYNWNLANLLRPYQDRPYLDADNLEQLKGWDLIAANFNYGSWQMAGYVVDLPQSGQSATTQQVLRMAYTGNIDGSWLVYQVPGSKPSWAANMSSLFGDHWLIRTEASVEQNREKASTPLSENQHEYIKWVVGLAYQSTNAGLFSAEYLYNQHGYSKAEWAFIEELILNGSETTSQSQQAVGQLRKHYVYLQYLSEESWDLWQYRQSVQINLDDDSQLHRLEVYKAFNDELSARLQLEYFSGCDTCEYGLAELTLASRLALYWSF
ncbi:MAG: hypothetical protein V7785_08275 [Bermanella sp.]